MSELQYVWLKPKEKMYVDGREVVKVKCIATQMDKLKAKGRLQGKQPDLRRKVFCYQTQSNYESVKDAADKLNLNASSISKICNKKQKTTEGYTFRFSI